MYTWCGARGNEKIRWRRHYPGCHKILHFIHIRLYGCFNLSGSTSSKGWSKGWGGYSFYLVFGLSWFVCVFSKKCFCYSGSAWLFLKRMWTLSPEWKEVGGQKSLKCWSYGLASPIWIYNGIINLDRNPRAGTKGFYFFPLFCVQGWA